MALEHTELKEACEEIEKRGIRFCLLEGKNEVPSLGELALSLEERLLCIGNGISEVGNSENTLSFSKELESLEEEEIVKVLWEKLNNTLCIGQVETILLPPLLHKKFEERKPPNFSFLRGEQLTKDSSFFSEWQYAPDAQERFFRIRDPRKPEEGGLDLDSYVKIEGGSLALRELGSQQNDSVGSHKHPLEVFGNQFWTENLDGAHTENRQVISSWGSFGNDNFLSENAPNQETRPKNISILGVWKTYEKN